ncbi:MAG: GSU2403 family nucleotidyltransferase fold protein [Rhizomicrobium sp.]
MAAPPLMMQTTYAELVERCASTAFADAFPDGGTFTPKTIRGRRYWYYQQSTGEGRAQRYVGAETPELLERIAHHKEIRDDERERRALVSALVRSFGLPRPIPEIGDVVATLAKAGVFRLRGVLVGTVAYQTYSAMLGVRLPANALSTEDIDVAQFQNVSIAVKDEIPPVLDILKEINDSFRAVPYTSDSRRATSYVANRGLRVDFLTPNEGSDTDEPQPLPALRTDAQPLRFLDFLIHDPEQAVVLHGSGIHVYVPTPERYAIHKLIVSRRRRAGSAKSDKDFFQSEALINVLAQKRAYELKSVWEEAVRRGQTWRQYLMESVIRLAPIARDTLLKTVDWRREQVPNLTLGFESDAPRYLFDRDVVAFNGKDVAGRIRCEISREALEDHFNADDLTKEGRVERFRENRSLIEQMASMKYQSWPVEEPGVILIRTGDVRKLRERVNDSVR